ncbi:hypothetical protein [Labrys monachus]|uniref:Uncharacterized protein n=1 Tax=Labrys monachus TaxID=217067 RepID=A0ABU0FJ43_9HYPH|nr:hypothetical protein [Labrys monachus]MDQ0394630.1 hypothetical protein [Labrys monachus]
MRIASLAAAALLAASVLPASAATLLEKNFWLSGPNYDGILPRCDDPAVTGKIATRFADKEADYWNSALTIERFDRHHQIAYSPWGRSFIPRRFCSARVLTSDGHYRRVSYSIAEDTGWLGATWGVEWCVDGTDRNLAYAPNCKMARP